MGPIQGVGPIQGNERKQINERTGEEKQKEKKQEKKKQGIYSRRRRGIECVGLPVCMCVCVCVCVWGGGSRGANLFPPELLVDCWASSCTSAPVAMATLLSPLPHT